jgi:hypothetical protein
MLNICAEPIIAAGCLAMPHLAHMLFAGVMCILFGGMTLLMVSTHSNNVACSNAR